MMRWLTMLDRFRNPRGREAELRLALAYHNVFNRTDNEDVQIVLADFAMHCGFYRVNPAGVSGDDRAFSDGLRAAFARVLRFARMTPEQQTALYEAARQEALAEAQTGGY